LKTGNKPKKKSKKSKKIKKKEGLLKKNKKYNNRKAKQHTAPKSSLKTKLQTPENGRLTTDKRLSEKKA